MVSTPKPKILNFSSPPKNSRVPDAEKKGNLFVQDWPVKPRKRNSITCPFLILDMPNVKCDARYHVADWGPAGYLASVFEGEVYMWHSNTNKRYVISSTGRRVGDCVKWNREGTQLAVALAWRAIIIWTSEGNKIDHKSKCPCKMFCRITSIDWAVGGKHLVTGCSNGRLTVWTSSLSQETHFYPAHRGSIENVTFSPLCNFFATSGEDEVVRVWKWPISEHFEIKDCYARGLAFHPWQDSLFAAGGQYGQISLWSTNALKNVGLKCPSQGEPFSLSCDELTWNKLTGELVVSYWNQDRHNRLEPRGESSICVFSNLNTVVDGIEWHVGRVPYLMWNPDGTQLATAGSDENLCVWEFVNPERKKELLSGKKRRSILDATVR